MDPPIRREYFNVKAFVDVNSWRLAEDCGETDAPDVTVPDAGRKQVNPLPASGRVLRNRTNLPLPVPRPPLKTAEDEGPAAGTAVCGFSVSEQIVC